MFSITNKTKKAFTNDESFSCYSETNSDKSELFREITCNVVVWNNFFFKSVRTGFGRLTHSYYLCKTFTSTFLQRCNRFLYCHDLTYLISLCTVTFFKIELYFLFSKRSGVFFLFLVVIYLEVPGMPLVLCSVHSIIT